MSSALLTPAHSITGESAAATGAAAGPDSCDSGEQLFIRSNAKDNKDQSGLRLPSISFLLCSDTTKNFGADDDVEKSNSSTSARFADSISPNPQPLQSQSLKRRRHLYELPGIPEISVTNNHFSPTSYSALPPISNHAAADGQQNKKRFFSTPFGSLPPLDLPHGSQKDGAAAMPEVSKSHSMGSKTPFNGPAATVRNTHHMQPQPQHGSHHRHHHHEHLFVDTVTSSSTMKRAWVPPMNNCDVDSGNGSGGLSVSPNSPLSSLPSLPLPEPVHLRSSYTAPQSNAHTSSSPYILNNDGYKHSRNGSDGTKTAALCLSGLAAHSSCSPSHRPYNSNNNNNNNGNHCFQNKNNGLRPPKQQQHQHHLSLPAVSNNNNNNGHHSRNKSYTENHPSSSYTLSVPKSHMVTNSRGAISSSPIFPPQYSSSSSTSTSTTTTPTSSDKLQLQQYQQHKKNDLSAYQLHPHQTTTALSKSYEDRYHHQYTRSFGSNPSYYTNSNGSNTLSDTNSTTTTMMVMMSGRRGSNESSSSSISSDRDLNNNVNKPLKKFVHHNYTSYYIPRTPSNSSLSGRLTASSTSPTLGVLSRRQNNHHHHHHHHHHHTHHDTKHYPYHQGVMTRRRSKTLTLPSGTTTKSVCHMAPGSLAMTTNTTSSTDSKSGGGPMRRTRNRFSLTSRILTLQFMVIKMKERLWHREIVELSQQIPNSNPKEIKKRIENLRSRHCVLVCQLLNFGDRRNSLGGLSNKRMLQNPGGGGYLLTGEHGGEEEEEFEGFLTDKQKLVLDKVIHRYCHSKSSTETTNTTATATAVNTHHSGIAAVAVGDNNDDPATTNGGGLSDGSFEYDSMDPDGYLNDEALVTEYTFKIILGLPLHSNPALCLLPLTASTSSSHELGNGGSNSNSNSGGGGCTLGNFVRQKIQTSRPAYIRYIKKTYGVDFH
ncbi:hypothetical protein H4219_004628 [Mycoemilia scoparia]|uniref:Uncharacterized protein n=1 Tax=Mycoemilia scoparia TaxID=417184 RepID=A0A9W7ZZ62_9FUNG|nr:hypothetical protein H4219_004628 [Mycoemilia scoparia]